MLFCICLQDIAFHHEVEDFGIDVAVFYHKNEDFDCLGQLHGFLVRTVAGGEGLENIGNLQNAGLECEFVFRELLRITGSVQFLSYHPQESDWLEPFWGKGQFVQYLEGHAGMIFDDMPFLCGEGAFAHA